MPIINHHATTSISNPATLPTILFPSTSKNLNHPSFRKINIDSLP